MDQAKPGMIVGKSVFNEEGKILVNYKVWPDRKTHRSDERKETSGVIH